MDDNKKLPKGWGEDEEIFDNDDSGSPWENKKSDDKKAEILNEDKTNSEEVVEKKNSKDFQAAIDDNQADISPTTTSNPKPAKSKTIPILVTIIIILVAALGGVGVLLLTKNKTVDTGGSESNTEQVTDIEKDESITTTVDKTTEITTSTATTTTEIVTTKATTTSAPDPYAEIKEQILYSVDNEYYSGKNSYLENASPNMVFYAQEKRKELQITDIPILSGPDASYSEIRSGYNGNAWVAAENDNWYYLQWIEGAGAFSHSCYGYVEKSSLNKKQTTPNYEDACIKALDKFIESYNAESIKYNHTIDSVRYDMFDVSGDGIPELFIEYETLAAVVSSLFVYNGTEYIEETFLGEGARVCLSEHLIEAYGYGGAVVRFIYKVDSNGYVTSKDEITEYGTQYSINDNPISYDKFNELNSYYDSLSWKNVGQYEYKRKSSGSQSTKKEIIVSEPGADFVFYADIPECPGSYSRVVDTEKDPLNLRSSPSTSADIITHIPKGTYIGEFAVNGEWSYVYYTDESGHDYWGYVSSKYLR
ncbi:MAG: SH3 domain-containing protein [Ruminococcus sp.]|nr:SH3 domain-containing protein [Ruminococcus sp.]